MINLPKGSALPLLPSSPPNALRGGDMLPALVPVAASRNRGRLIMVVTILFSALIGAGIWYWRTTIGMPVVTIVDGRAGATAGLDERLREQYARLEEMRSRVALAGNSIRELERALAELDNGRTEISGRDPTESSLPRTLDEIVSVRSHRVAASTGAHTAMHASLRVEHLSSDIGIPPEEIRRILGPQGEPR